MKSMTLIALTLFISACSSLTPDGGNKVALNKDKFPSSSTIVFGRIIDLNPQSVKSKLQLTYTLSNATETGLFNIDNNFPNLDPDSNYFWIAIPTEKAQYFGVRSIRFMIDGVSQTAVMRDEKNHKPLFGTNLNTGSGAKYIYVGDITIRSGLRKTSSGLNLEIFDIKEAYNKSNTSSAKNFLQEKGVDAQKLVVQPLNLRKI